MTLLILLACLLILGAIFALIKVYLVGDALAGSRIIQENGTISVHMCRSEDCGAAMVAAIGTADDVTCAFYELNHPAVIDALGAKGAYVLVDEDNAAEVEGLAVEVVPSVGLMHDKFCVLDGRTVITGSMNPTVNDIERNDNNLLIIDSPSLASRYAQEFEEMRSRTDRTYTKRPPRPHIVNISGTVVEQYFCPQEGCEAEVISEIALARDSVAFMLFTFTADPVGDEMLSASDRGAAVGGIVEDRQADTYSEHVRMQEFGLDVRNDGNRYTMHHKVIIIDNTTVITGSYNPTKSATERNDENLLIIHSPAIAARYAQEFERVMAQAR